MEQREKKKEKIDKSQLVPKTTSSKHSTFDRNTRHLKVAAVCDGNIQLPRAEQNIRKRSQVMKSFILTNITSSPPIYHPIHPVREPLSISIYIPIILHNASLSRNRTHKFGFNNT